MNVYQLAAAQVNIINTVVRLNVYYIEPDPCTLDPYKGPCNGQIQRYFYNVTSSKCERFLYGGCYGNENNFFNIHDCEEKCSGEIIITLFIAGMIDLCFYCIVCPPTCSPVFCAVKRTAVCTM